MCPTHNKNEIFGLDIAEAGLSEISLREREHETASDVQRVRCSENAHLLDIDAAQSASASHKIGNSSPLRVYPRPRVEGKFLFHGDEKLYIRGATYGTFAANEFGEPFPSQEQVANDFSAMASSGVNAVRVYTVPPRWLLDIALTNHLLVLVGIPWEQHLAFLDDADTAKRIQNTCRKAAEDCRYHPALLGYSLGNEISGNVIRWLGRVRVQKFLHKLYRTVKSVDPDSLVTYVNFPTTEYLELEFLDFISFNVYLESRENLDAYIARLHCVAGEKPLLLAEVGMDSQRNGELLQAQTLKWQIDSVFDAGCAGTFVYAWTDEWFTEGHEIEDWDFGLTTRDRLPKAALSVVRKKYKSVPFHADKESPSVCVVVCSYNGSATIAETISAIQKLDYPDFELIVVDDGSTDETARIAKSLNAHVVSTPNRGLSNARNTGWQMSSAEIIAFCDDDAYPDKHWLRYLAVRYRDASVGAVGGPNLAPRDDGMVADCVSAAPGGPVEVLISDTSAEHIPGCNMSIRRCVLEEVGGFDAQFTAAGDDVDMCWKILENGHEIGFHPAALNWHHRRNSVSTYLCQQKGYGRAEALLARKWPGKYNAMGYTEWQGVIYGKGLVNPLGLLRNRVYSGVWGSAAFQRLYKDKKIPAADFLLIPDTLLFMALLVPFAILGIWVQAFGAAQILLGALSVLLLIQAVVNSIRSVERPIEKPLLDGEYVKRLSLTTCLYLLQPIYRLKGRLLCTHTSVFKFKHLNFRKSSDTKLHITKLKGQIWEGQNKGPLDRLSALYTRFNQSGLNIENGDPCSGWDMTLTVIPFGSARMKLMVEAHGDSVDLVRYRFRPCLTAVGRLVLGIGALCFAFSMFLSLSSVAVTSALLMAFVLLFAATGSVLAMTELEWELKQESARAGLENQGE